MPAKRVNDGALGGAERTVLAWLADRVPRSVTPDHLTSLGFVGALTAACGYLASRLSIEWLWLASVGLAVNWVGDSLDGTVARLRRIERPRYGFFVDHTCDLFSQSMIFLTLGLSPCAHFSIGCVGLVAFLMAFVYSLICVEVHDTLRITYFRFGPTEIRAMLIAGNLLTLWAGGVPEVSRWLRLPARFGAVTIYELFIVGISAVMFMALVVLALRERAVLAREEPPAPSSRQPSIGSSPAPVLSVE